MGKRLPCQKKVVDTLSEIWESICDVRNTSDNQTENSAPLSGKFPPLLVCFSRHLSAALFL